MGILTSRLESEASMVSAPRVALSGVAACANRGIRLVCTPKLDRTVLWRFGGGGGARAVIVRLACLGTRHGMHPVFVTSSNIRGKARR